MSLNNKGLIVITGASSGLGAATAKKLAEVGYHVIAGILPDDDPNDIKSDNIEPFILDITNKENIFALSNRIANDKNKSKLHVLINNAGIEFNAPFELLELDEWRKQFEVNLFGQVAITRELLPFLRESKGTIINITSVGGKVALPNYSAYASSKFAFEGMSDSLRREVKDQGIRVIVVEPGGIKTKMAAYSGDLSLNFEKSLNENDKKLYSNLIKSAVASQSNFLRHALSSEKAANTISKILSKSHPRAHYSLGMDAKMSIPLARFFPTRFVDWSLELSRRFAK